jgi:hypothetical protein
VGQGVPQDPVPGSDFGASCVSPISIEIGWKKTVLLLIFAYSGVNKQYLVSMIISPAVGVQLEGLRVLNSAGRANCEFICKCVHRFG